jgi:hypothetical protein
MSKTQSCRSLMIKIQIKASVNVTDGVTQQMG